MITLKNYTFINCTSNNLKCSNGLCFEKFTFDNQTATCTSNKSSLISLGWWKVIKLKNLFFFCKFFKLNELKIYLA